MQMWKCTTLKQNSHILFDYFSDIDYIDHSFGFNSAVEAAQVAIRSA